jgi:hypothetical protein
MVIPLLLLFELCFVSIFFAGLKGSISDVPSFSVGWWVLVIIFGAISLVNGILMIATTISTIKTFTKPAYLRINAEGIWLPYQTHPIKWIDIEYYSVQEYPWMKGGAAKFLYVFCKKGKFSVYNIFMSRKFTVLGRKVADDDDISRCLVWIDRFLLA